MKKEERFFRLPFFGPWFFRPRFLGLRFLGLRFLRRRIDGLAMGFLVLLALALPYAAAADRGAELPHIVLITVDTLRADHLSVYGYERPTSPHIDVLMNRGVRFTEARTPIPLTCPAFTTLFTTFGPHLHGATRNGVPIRERLPSLPKLLQRAGYTTAAFVSNWVLRDEVCGLGEHFDLWEEVLTRRMLFFGQREANADDVTEEALDFLDDRDDPRRPVFLWVHYMEPHFPYQLQEDHLEQLGLRRGGSLFSIRDRYDSEIARVDAAVGELLAEIDERLGLDETLVLFTADHGESLGEHGYRGHGRHLYEASLHVPMSVTWPERIRPQVLDAPALNSDLTPTLLGLLGLPVPGLFEGWDFSPTLFDPSVAPPDGRQTLHQAHSNAVTPNRREKRRKGLLEVGRVADGRKEILVVRRDLQRIFDLEEDRGEVENLAGANTALAPELEAWLAKVRDGLETLDKDLPPPAVDAETLDQLEALGYVD